MKISSEVISAGAVIVSFDIDNLDAGNVKEFKESLQVHMEANDIVLLDMRSLGFVDSSGLGALLSCMRVMNNKDGQLKLFALAKPVQALFELVRMNRIFAIYPDRDAALASL